MNHCLCSLTWTDFDILVSGYEMSKRRNGTIRSILSLIITDISTAP